MIEISTSEVFTRRTHQFFLVKNRGCALIESSIVIRLAVLLQRQARAGCSDHIAPIYLGAAELHGAKQREKYG